MAEENSQSSSQPKMITLKSADNVLFEVEINVAKEMKICKAFIEDSEDTEIIPTPNVFGKELAVIIEYCKKQVKEQSKEFEAEFVKDRSSDEVKELLVAANYLNIPSLLECLCKNIADHIQNKSPEYVRKFFNIENDFEPDEEAKLRKEYEWAFEGVDKD